MYSSWALFVLYEVQLDNKLAYGRRRQINSTPLKLLDKNTCHKNIVAHDKNTCRRNSAAHGKNTCCTITRLSDCLLHEYYHCNSEFVERTTGFRANIVSTLLSTFEAHVRLNATCPKTNHCQILNVLHDSDQIRTWNQAKQVNKTISSTSVSIHNTLWLKLKNTMEARD